MGIRTPDIEIARLHKAIITNLRVDPDLTWLQLTKLCNYRGGSITGFKSIMERRGISLKKMRLEAWNEQEHSPGALSEQEEQLLKLCSLGEPCRIVDLADLINEPPKVVRHMIEVLQERGHDLGYLEETDSAHIEVNEIAPIKLPSLKGRKTLRYGLVSDSHLCSKYQQLRLLHTAYKWLEGEGAEFILHLGDVCDGRGVYRGQDHELFLFGADDQTKYCVDKLPESPLKTYVLAGNHDESWHKKVGYDIVRAICEQRPNYEYIGRIRQTFYTDERPGFRFVVCHPKGGGGYAKSYKPQRLTASILDSVMAEVRKKDDTSIIPDAVVFGHWHFALMMPLISCMVNVVPCFQRQTPYLAALGLVPRIGATLMEVQMNEQGNAVNIQPRFQFYEDEIVDKDYPRYSS